MKHWFKKSVSTVVIAVMLADTCFAQVPGLSFDFAVETPKLIEIDIPAELASVEEFWEAPPRANPKMILQIQNAHTNYEAQEKIRDLMTYLNQNYGFKTIFVEGAADVLDPNYLKLFPDVETNRKLWDELAKRGQITGADWFLLDGPKDIQGVGIENADLYRQNYEALKKVYSREEETTKFLTGLEMELDKLATQILLPETRKIIKEWRKFELGHREFMPFVETLADLVEENLDLDLKELYSQITWPQLTRLIVLQQMESKLQQVEVEGKTKKDLALLEKKQMVQWLEEKDFGAKLIEGLERFNERDINMNRIRATPGKMESLPRFFIEKLIDETSAQGLKFSDYPNFALYTGYMILKYEIEPNSLFDEIRTLFGQLLEKGTKDKEQGSVIPAKAAIQSDLITLFRDAELMRKLFNLELSREEWVMVLTRKAEVEPQEMFRRIKALADQDTLPDKKADAQLSEYQKTILDAYQSALSFYDLAIRRDEVFYQKMARELESTDRAILMTGGFHTDGLREIFRSNDISYGTVTPRLTELKESSLYRDVMTGKVSTSFHVATVEIKSMLATNKNVLSMEADRNQLITQMSVLLDSLLAVSDGEKRAVAIQKLEDYFDGAVVINQNERTIKIRVTQGEESLEIDKSRSESRGGPKKETLQDYFTGEMLDRRRLIEAEGVQKKSNPEAHRIIRQQARGMFDFLVDALGLQDHPEFMDMDKAFSRLHIVIDESMPGKTIPQLTGDQIFIVMGDKNYSKQALAAELGHALHNIAGLQSGSKFHRGIAEAFDEMAQALVLTQSGNNGMVESFHDGRKRVLNIVKSAVGKRLLRIQDLPVYSEQNKEQWERDYGVVFQELKASGELSDKELSILAGDAKYGLHHFIGLHLFEQLIEVNAGNVVLAAQQLGEVLKDPKKYSLENPSMFSLEVHLSGLRSKLYQHSLVSLVIQKFKSLSFFKVRALNVKGLKDFALNQDLLVSAMDGLSKAFTLGLGASDRQAEENLLAEFLESNVSMSIRYHQFDLPKTLFYISPANLLARAWRRFVNPLFRDLRDSLVFDIESKYRQANESTTIPISVRSESRKPSLDDAKETVLRSLGLSHGSDIADLGLVVAINSATPNKARATYYIDLMPQQVDLEFKESQWVITSSRYPTIAAPGSRSESRKDIFTDAVVEKVLAEYGIHDYKWSYFDEENKPQVVLIETEGKKYVSKSPHFRNTPGLIDWEASVLNEMKSNGVKVSGIVATNTESNYVEENGDVFALYEFLEGNNSYGWGEIEGANLDLAGKHLAQMHQAMSAFNPTGSNYTLDNLPQMFPVAFLEHGLKKLEELRGQLQGRAPPELNDVELLFLEQFDEIARHAEMIRSQLAPIVLRLNETIVHGDYHQGNMFFNASSVALTDFEYAHRDKRIYDLAGPITMRKQAGSPVTFSLEKTEQFILAYDQALPEDSKLTDVELDSLQHVYRLRYLEGVNMFTGILGDKNYLGGLEEQLANLKTIDQADWAALKQRIVAARSESRFSDAFNLARVFNVYKENVFDASQYKNLDPQGVYKKFRELFREMDEKTNSVGLLGLESFIAPDVDEALLPAFAKALYMHLRAKSPDSKTFSSLQPEASPSISEAMVSGFSLSFYEILKNAVIWGNRAGKDKGVVVQWKFEEGNLILTVSDEGEVFRPEDKENLPDGVDHWFAGSGEGVSTISMPYLLPENINDGLYGQAITGPLGTHLGKSVSISSGRQVRSESREMNQRQAYIDSESTVAIPIYVGNEFEETLRSLSIGTRIGIFGSTALAMLLGENGPLSILSISDFTTDLDVYIEKGDALEVETAFSHYKPEIVDESALKYLWNVNFRLSNLHLIAEVGEDQEVSYSLVRLTADGYEEFSANEVPDELADLREKRLVDESEDGMFLINAFRAARMQLRFDLNVSDELYREIKFVIDESRYFAPDDYRNFSDTVLEELYDLQIKGLEINWQIAAKYFGFDDLQKLIDQKDKPGSSAEIVINQILDQVTDSEARSESREGLEEDSSIKRVTEGVLSKASLIEDFNKFIQTPANRNRVIGFYIGAVGALVAAFALVPLAAMTFVVSFVLLAVISSFDLMEEMNKFFKESRPVEVRTEAISSPELVARGSRSESRQISRVDLEDNLPRYGLARSKDLWLNIKAFWSKQALDELIERDNFRDNLINVALLDVRHDLTQQLSSREELKLAKSRVKAMTKVLRDHKFSQLAVTENDEGEFTSVLAVVNGYDVDISKDLKRQFPDRFIPEDYISAYDGVMIEWFSSGSLAQEKLRFGQAVKSFDGVYPALHWNRAPPRIHELVESLPDQRIASFETGPKLRNGNQSYAAFLGAKGASEQYVRESVARDRSRYGKRSFALLVVLAGLFFSDSIYILRILRRHADFDLARTPAVVMSELDLEKNPNYIRIAATGPYDKDGKTISYVRAQGVDENPQINFSRNKQTGVISYAAQVNVMLAIDAQGQFSLHSIDHVRTNPQAYPASKYPQMIQIGPVAYYPQGWNEAGRAPGLNEKIFDWSGGVFGGAKTFLAVTENAKGRQHLHVLNFLGIDGFGKTGPSEEGLRKNLPEKIKDLTERYGPVQFVVAVDAGTTGVFPWQKGSPYWVAVDSTEMSAIEKLGYSQAMQWIGVLGLTGASFGLLFFGVKTFRKRTPKKRSQLREIEATLSKSETSSRDSRSESRDRGESALKQYSRRDFLTKAGQASLVAAFFGVAAQSVQGAAAPKSSVPADVEAELKAFLDRVGDPSMDQLKATTIETENKLQQEAEVAAKKEGITFVQKYYVQQRLKAADTNLTAIMSNVFEGTAITENEAKSLKELGLSIHLIESGEFRYLMQRKWDKKTGKPIRPIFVAVGHSQSEAGPFSSFTAQDMVRRVQAQRTASDRQKMLVNLRHELAAQLGLSSEALIYLRKYLAEQMGNEKEATKFLGRILAHEIITNRKTDALFFTMILLTSLAYDKTGKMSETNGNAEFIKRVRQVDAAARKNDVGDLSLFYGNFYRKKSGQEKNNLGKMKKAAVAIAAYKDATPTLTPAVEAPVLVDATKQPEKRVVRAIPKVEAVEDVVAVKRPVKEVIVALPNDNQVPNYDELLTTVTPSEGSKIESTFKRVFTFVPTEVREVIEEEPARAYASVSIWGFAFLFTTLAKEISKNKVKWANRQSWSLIALNAAMILGGLTHIIVMQFSSNADASFNYLADFIKIFWVSLAAMDLMLIKNWSDKNPNTLRGKAVLGLERGLTWILKKAFSLAWISLGAIFRQKEVERKKVLQVVASKSQSTSQRSESRLIKTENIEPRRDEELAIEFSKIVQIFDSVDSTRVIANENPEASLDKMMNELKTRELSTYELDLMEFFVSRSLLVEYRPGLYEGNDGAFGHWDSDNERGQPFAWFSDGSYVTGHVGQEAFKDIRTPLQFMFHEMSHVRDGILTLEGAEDLKVYTYIGERRPPTHRLGYQEYRANLWAFSGDINLAHEATQRSYTAVSNTVSTFPEDLRGILEEQSDEIRNAIVYRALELLSQATNDQLYEGDERLREGLEKAMSEFNISFARSESRSFDVYDVDWLSSDVKGIDSDSKALLGLRVPPQRPLKIPVEQLQEDEVLPIYLSWDGSKIELKYSKGQATLSWNAGENVMSLPLDKSVRVGSKLNPSAPQDISFVEYKGKGAISRQHISIRFDGDSSSIYITDLGSKNGTFIATQDVARMQSLGASQKQKEAKLILAINELYKEGGSLESASNILLGEEDIKLTSKDIQNYLDNRKGEDFRRRRGNLYRHLYRVGSEKSREAVLTYFENGDLAVMRILSRRPTGYLRYWTQRLKQDEVDDLATRSYSQQMKSADAATQLEELFPSQKVEPEEEFRTVMQHELESSDEIDSIRQRVSDAVLKFNGISSVDMSAVESSDGRVRFNLSSDSEVSPRYQAILNTARVALDVLFSSKSNTSSILTDESDFLDQDGVLIRSKGYHDFESLSPREVLGNDFSPLPEKVRDYFQNSAAEWNALRDYVDSDLMHDLILHIGNKRAETTDVTHLIRQYLMSVYAFKNTSDVNALKKVLSDYLRFTYKFSKFFNLGRTKVYSAEKDKWYFDETEVVSRLNPARVDFRVVSNESDSMPESIVSDFVSSLPNDWQASSDFFLDEQVYDVGGRLYVLAARNGRIEVYYASATYSAVAGHHQWSRQEAVMVNRYNESAGYRWAWFAKPATESGHDLSVAASAKINDFINEGKIKVLSDLEFEESDISNRARVLNLFIDVGLAATPYGKFLARNSNGDIIENPLGLEIDHDRYPGWNGIAVNAISKNEKYNYVPFDAENWEKQPLGQKEDLDASLSGDFIAQVDRTPALAPLLKSSRSESRSRIDDLKGVISWVSSKGIVEFQDGRKVQFTEIPRTQGVKSVFTYEKDGYVAVLKIARDSATGETFRNEYDSAVRLYEAGLKGFQRPVIKIKLGSDQSNETGYAIIMESPKGILLSDVEGESALTRARRFQAVMKHVDDAFNIGKVALHDIKDANSVVVPAGEIVLIDYEVSNTVEETSSRYDTVDGGVSDGVMEGFSQYLNLHIDSNRRTELLKLWQLFELTKFFNEYVIGRDGDIESEVLKSYTSFNEWISVIRNLNSEGFKSWFEQDAVDVFASYQEFQNTVNAFAQEQWEISQRSESRDPIEAELVSSGEYRLLDHASMQLQQRLNSQRNAPSLNLGSSLSVYRTTNAPSGKVLYYFALGKSELGVALSNNRLKELESSDDPLVPQRIQFFGLGEATKWMFVEQEKGMLRGLRFPEALRGQGYSKQILETYLNVSGVMQTSPEIRNMLLLRILLKETFNVNGARYQFKYNPADNDQVLPLYVKWSGEGASYRALILNKHKDLFNFKRGATTNQVSGKALFDFEFVDELPSDIGDYQMMPLNVSLVLEPVQEARSESREESSIGIRKMDLEAVSGYKFDQIPFSEQGLRQLAEFSAPTILELANQSVENRQTANGFSRSANMVMRFTNPNEWEIENPSALAQVAVSPGWLTAEANDEGVYHRTLAVLGNLSSNYKTLYDKATELGPLDQAVLDDIQLRMPKGRGVWKPNDYGFNRFKVSFDENKNIAHLVLVPDVQSAYDMTSLSRTLDERVAASKKYRDDIILIAKYWKGVINFFDYDMAEKDKIRISGLSLDSALELIPGKENELEFLGQEYGLTWQQLETISTWPLENTWHIEHFKGRSEQRLGSQETSKAPVELPRSQLKVGVPTLERLKVLEGEQVAASILAAALAGGVAGLASETMSVATITMTLGGIADALESKKLESKLPEVFKSKDFGRWSGDGVGMTVELISEEMLLEMNPEDLRLVLNQNKNSKYGFVLLDGVFNEAWESLKQDFKERLYLNEVKDGDVFRAISSVINAKGVASSLGAHKIQITGDAVDLSLARSAIDQSFSGRVRWLSFGNDDVRGHSAIRLAKTVVASQVSSLSALPLSQVPVFEESDKKSEWSIIKGALNTLAGRLALEIQAATQAAISA